MLKTVRISEASWRSYGRAFKRFESVINLNRKLDISTAPTKAKSREAAYSQALVDKKIDRRSQDQTVRGLWWMVFELRRGGIGREKRIKLIRIGFLLKSSV